MDTEEVMVAAAGAGDGVETGLVAASREQRSHISDCCFINLGWYIRPLITEKANLGAVVEHGVYPVFYSVFPIFLPILLSPPEVFLAFAQSKRPSQRLTMSALLSLFLTPIRRPGIPVVHWLL
jgi:hypothetical protein